MTKQEIKNILQTKTVAIAGVGGLGSNCAIALARTGVGKLIIADFDVVDTSNIDRQYFFINQIGQQKIDALADNILQISPNTTIVKHNIKLTDETIVSLFKDAEIIVEAFDNATMKQRIIETVLTQMPDKYLVCGIGIAGFGNNNKIKTKQPLEKLFICGDFESEISDNYPPLAPKVAIVANMQANKVIEILLTQQS